MIDALAYERQFVDHIAPVWKALPKALRGTFWTDPSLETYCRSLGVDGTPRLINRSEQEPRGDSQALVAAYGDIKKGRRIGIGSFIFMEHGIGQSYGNRHGSYAGGSDRDDVELFLLPNEYSAALWRKSYPQARVEIIGCPKLDDTPAYESTDPPLVAVSFHWDAPIAPESRGAFSYYRRILPLIHRHSYSLLGHGHPRILPVLSRYYVSWGMEVIRDFREVLARAAVYVCDNSSSIYEFAATGRPVVVLNQPAYRRNVDHGLRFWEASTVGIQVNHPHELEAAIGAALADEEPLPTNREQALDLVYAYRSGAAARAVAAITRSGVLAA